MTPLPNSNVAVFPNTTLIPRAWARVCKTAIVWGWQASSTKKVAPSPLRLTLSVMAMASAAAVPSSRRDALAISRPVRSDTAVWKLSSASSRPCDISAWYGVYEVYQPGFSKMLRRMTGGVMQSEYPIPM